MTTHPAADKARTTELERIHRCYECGHELHLSWEAPEDAEILCADCDKEPH